MPSLVARAFNETFQYFYNVEKYVDNVYMYVCMHYALLTRRYIIVKSSKQPHMFKRLFGIPKITKIIPFAFLIP